jgi:DNA-binding Lrp family transcriptional regulator
MRTGLEEDKYKIAILPDVIPLGFMLIQCREGSDESILEQIRVIPGVAYAYRIGGTYDIIAKIEAASGGKFPPVIAAVRKIPNILNTDTIICLKQ